MNLFVLCVVWADWIPSTCVIIKMPLTFIRKGVNSANQSVKFFTRLFILGHDFMKLCDVIDVDAMQFYKLSFGTVNRIVYNHFRDSCLE